MTSPGGRIEIRVDPDLRGFGNRLSSGLSDSARTGVAAFAAAAKTALLGAAVGIGAAGIIAAKSTLDIGMAYQDQLNTLQAVSKATEVQMRSVGQTAKTLGADLTLPATSAADAAAVMTELAKGGLSVDQAMQAAKGSLQLAAAAQVDGAQAAQIQANSLNAFGLSADQASRVADVLAATANAASGEITDMAAALAQGAAVASAMGISIEDTSTAIGLLAKNGILGSDAGTLLKSALLALQSPSKQAQGAMDALKLSAFDASGNFVGLRSIFDQLAAAQGSMTQEAYAAATSTLFGSDAARLAGIAAREGAAGWDVMSTSVHRQGAAMDIAAAKAKGLRGAIEAFKSQVETVQIDVFERAAPSLERLVRAAAERLPEVAESALETADDVVASFQELAPRIGRALDARRDAVVAAWEKLGQPLLEGARDLADKGLDVVVDGAERLGELAGDAVDTVEPLADAVGELASSLAEAGGPLDAVGGGLEVVADGAGLALDVLGPFVGLASDLVGVVTDLPGPLQTAVLGFAAFRLFGSRAGEWATSGFTGRIVNPFVQFGQTVRTQMALADDSITRSEAFRGGLATAIERQAPAVAGAWNQITGAYRGGVAEASQAWTKHGLAVDGFASRVHGLSRAAQTAGSVGIGGLRAAGGGLVNFMGGPWGIALAGAGLVVGGITASLQEATSETEEWTRALLAGGQAAADVQKKHQAERDKQPFEWMADLDEWTGMAPSLSEAQTEARRLRAEMEPLARAQSDVTARTNDLNLAIDRHGAGSREAKDAANSLSAAQGRLAGVQDAAARATQTHTERMQEQAQQALAATNADVAASMAQTSLQSTIASTAETLSTAAAGSMEAQQATDQLTQSALAAAQAAADQARAHSNARSETGLQQEADKALLASLQATAAQLGVNTPAAITNLISTLEGSAGAARNVKESMEDLGVSVQDVPNSKTVFIDAPTAEQKARIEGLGLAVRYLPNGKIYVTADTSAAETALQTFMNRRRTITIQAAIAAGNPLTAAGRVTAATGGYITGPGTGTSDSIPAWLSNGEYVIQAAMTSRSRPGLEAANRGDWATAAQVFSTLAERQSRAALAAVAGNRAASVAGRYAAGGYVDGLARAAAMPAVVTVPQRVQNINNTLNAAPSLPTLDQLERMQRKAEVLASV